MHNHRVVDVTQAALADSGELPSKPWCHLPSCSHVVPFFRYQTSTKKRRAPGKRVNRGGVKKLLALALALAGRLLKKAGLTYLA